VKLGVFYDMPYRSQNGVVTADVPVIRFITSLPPRVDEIVLLGRLDPEPGRFTYEVAGEQVRLVPLPFYSSIFDLPGMLRAMPGSVRRFLAELPNLDAVWIFGPNPMSIVLASVALARRKQVFLGVRQDYPEYIAARLPSPRWRWALPVANLLEHAFRLIARRVPTTVEGEQIAANYRGGRAPVLSGGFSMIRAAELVPRDEALSRSWDGEVTLVSVGRIDAEKNPLLLIDIVARLDALFRLVVVGDGPLMQDMRRAVAERGLGDRIDLLGYVQNGEPLWDVYRASHAFLHVSLTEGHPMVFFEAESTGLPIAATDVGGVSAALGGGERGLLFPPRDAGAAVAAVEQLAADPELRERLIRAGMEHAEAHTMEARLDAVAEFFRANSSAR
jgi:glycosyltransferase involved in cell wall biosynthesis